MSETKYWLGFSLIPNLGSVRIQYLKNVFGELEHAWLADISTLKQTELEPYLVTEIATHRPKIDLDAELEKVERVRASLITLADDNYPPLLKQIPQPPPILYVRGNILEEDAKALGVVGTRKATNYGRDVAFQLSKQLAQQDITIISGLAQGVDLAAHQGALAGEGRTFAILGSGIDNIYPTEHEKIAHDIIQNGALISEFPIGMPPYGKNFPRRNRVLSGLSLGILVVEAPEKSGSLITAEIALEQGREVFAVPNNIFNPMGRGANRLIQDGAKPVLRIRDILDELDFAYEKIETQTTTEIIVPANEIEDILLNQLSADPIHIDDLVRITNLPIQTVSSTLTIMELKGMIQMVGQMQYCRINI